MSSFYIVVTIIFTLVLLISLFMIKNASEHKEFESEETELDVLKDIRNKLLVKGNDEDLV